MTSKPKSSKNHSPDMVAYADADGRLSPAKAMIEYYMMNLDAFPKARAAFPGIVAMKLGRKKKSLHGNMPAEDFHALDWEEIRAACEWEALQEIFPAMPRVVAMKESAPYIHSKMPSIAQLDINDNRVADKIINAQARLATALADVYTKQKKQGESAHDVTPPSGLAAVITNRAKS